jgi:hypothetical protein
MGDGILLYVTIVDIGGKHMEVILVFNKFTKAYIGFTYGSDDMNVGEDTLDHTHFLFKTIEMDIETECWHGDFDNGTVIKTVDEPVRITETELDADCQYKIFRRYKYYHQLNVLFGVIDKLIEKVGLADDEQTDYLDMKTYLQKIRENNERYKETYKQHNHYRYLDKEQEVAEVNSPAGGWTP